MTPSRHLDSSVWASNLHWDSVCSDSIPNLPHTDLLLWPSHDNSVSISQAFKNLIVNLISFSFYTHIQSVRKSWRLHFQNLSRIWPPFPTPSWYWASLSFPLKNSSSLLQISYCPSLQGMNWKPRVWWNGSQTHSPYWKQSKCWARCKKNVKNCSSKLGKG